VNEFAEGFALVGVQRGQLQRLARAADGAGAKFEAPDIQDIKGDLVALVDLSSRFSTGTLASWKSPDGWMSP